METAPFVLLTVLAVSVGFVSQADAQPTLPPSSTLTTVVDQALTLLGQPRQPVGPFGQRPGILPDGSLHDTAERAIVPDDEFHEIDELPCDNFV